MHLYIHIPFCRQACHYCDFHFSTSLQRKEDVVLAIAQEIKLQANYLANKTLETIYFGGGTPSLLEEKDFEHIFTQIYSTFSLTADAEITLEANPDDLTLEKLQLFNKVGINRLSIGIQSFNDEHLKKLHRIHSGDEAHRCVSMAQDVGITNLSIDLIYAIPSDSHAILHEDLVKATSLGVTHISAYCLTIEPQTVFGKWLKQRKIAAIDDEFASQQFEILLSHLNEQGFEQYEISNFAKNEAYSRHNTSYWKQEEYLGVGPSAHSFNHISRQYNVANNAQYLKAMSQNQIPAEVEVLTKEDRFNEYLLTGLRTKWGCELTRLDGLIGTDFRQFSKAILDEQLHEGLILLDGTTMRLTNKGKLFADKIVSDLFLA
ncbi:MAG: radical SAM family heme chaperone HemW [Spirosomataceae bacterium]